ncbi:MAG: aminotransferase class IV [Chitinophagaceae bacterium]
MNDTGDFICINGTIIPANQPVLMTDNRSFRYGDGLFETMKMINGKIILEELHFDRLLKSLKFLKYDLPVSFTIASIRESVQVLAEKNNVSDFCRIRLTISRGNGNLHSSALLKPEYLIECSVPDVLVNRFNEKGLSVSIYKEARKTCDIISTIKSANFLPYVLGALYAKENNIDDSILLNVNAGIADATIANIFLIKDGVVYTPALTEGCINGVMRRYLLEQFAVAGITYREGTVLEQDLLQADEVFLTNAVTGIRWVKNCAGKEYSSVVTERLYNDFIKTIFS